MRDLFGASAAGMRGLDTAPPGPAVAGRTLATKQDTSCARIRIHTCACPRPLIRALSRTWKVLLTVAEAAAAASSLSRYMTRSASTGRAAVVATAGKGARRDHQGRRRPMLRVSR